MRPSASRFRGVWFNQPQKKWIAQIGVDRKPVLLGGFDREEDAARAYNQAAKEYFGEFAHLNPVE